MYGSNEGAAIGVVHAVQELGITGKLSVVGFDSGKDQIDAINSGLMAGAITQNPVGIGYETVKAAVAVIKGQSVPKTIDTGYFWYDKTNITDAKITEVLVPVTLVRGGCAGHRAAQPPAPFDASTPPRRPEAKMVRRQFPRPKQIADLLRFRKPTWSPTRRRLRSALTIEDLRTIARRRTPRAAFDYTDGAAEAELSLGAGPAGVPRHRVPPGDPARRLHVDTGWDVLGAPVGCRSASRPPASPG